MGDRIGQVVRLLADGNPRSGDAMAVALGISRTAVWKTIRQVREHLGLEIEAVRGHGYRLREPLELLEPDRILSGLGGDARPRLRRLDVLASVDSTSSLLLERARAESTPGVSATASFDLDAIDVCLAERQTAGRGRLGRRWVSPYGRNLYLSLLWRCGLSPAELGGLSLACGVAVATALRRFGATGIGLKWPNDLHWRRRKIAGLLLEVGGESQGPSYAVVGVGVNLRLSPGQGAGIDQPWVDLAEVLGQRMPARNEVAVALISALCAALLLYRDQRLAPFLDDWRSLDAYRDETVELVAGAQRITGAYCGINDQGALLLRTPDGLRSYAAGELSLRALSGPDC